MGLIGTIITTFNHIIIITIYNHTLNKKIKTTIIESNLFKIEFIIFTINVTKAIYVTKAIIIVNLYLKAYRGFYRFVQINLIQQD